MGNNLRFAFHRTVPIMIGFFPLGIAYGVLMENAGYNFTWTFFCSVIVLSGSLQYLMLTFFAGGISLITVLVMAMLLNSRHLFYGISFIDQFKSYGPWKYFMIYGLADENYSLLCAYNHEEGLDDKKVNTFSSLLVVLYWVIFSTLGGLIGPLITFNTTGIDFALTALFIVIVLDQLKDADTKLPAILAAGSSLLCLALLGPDNFLLPSLLVTVGLLVLFRSRLERTEKEAAK